MVAASPRARAAKPAEEAPQEPPLRHSRITRAPGHREPMGGHYCVRNPDHGTTSIMPEPVTPVRKVSRAPAALGARDADAYFEAAELLAQRGDARAAVLAAQKAMKLAQPRPLQQALYAWLLYMRDGQTTPVHPHVFRHLDEALARDPACVYAHCFMGVLLTRMGRVEQARRHLIRALELDPDHHHAARALELLETQSA